MQIFTTFALAYSSAADINWTAPDLSNHWLEVAASLVNEQTGRGSEVPRSLEYYEGVKDSAPWTKGDRSDSAVSSGLPLCRNNVRYRSPARQYIGAEHQALRGFEADGPRSPT